MQLRQCLLLLRKKQIVIEEYSTDLPYPSCLRLGTIKNRPIHVVTAEATEDAVTAGIQVDIYTGAAA